MENFEQNACKDPMNRHGAFFALAGIGARTLHSSATDVAAASGSVPVCNHSSREAATPIVHDILPEIKSPALSPRQSEHRTVHPLPRLIIPI